jgi:UDP-glucose 4-epimerase
VFKKGASFVKILVTGGAGYIGGAVTALLAEKGHEAVVFDNLSHGRRDLLPPGVEFVQGELADRSELENIFIAARNQGKPFDGVLHFAALIEAGESMLRPELFFRNNTASTLSLLEAILAHGPRRLVFSSTAAVYGEPESVPITEDARLLPTNAYGESKLLVEQMLGWLNRIHGLRYASLRYFNVAGAPEGPEGVTRGEAHEPESHLIPLVLDVALGRRNSIKIFGDDYPTPDGTCIRDYIHVSDLADAHLLAFDALETRDRLIFNLGNGRGFSVREVIESARRVTGHPIPAEVHPRRPGDPAVLVASSEKAIRELGWKPKYTQLDEIVRTAWAWHRKRYGG